MARAAAVFASFAIAANAVAPAVNARFVGVFRGSSTTDCSLLQINPNDGTNKTVSAVDACVGLTNTWPSYSALNEANELEVVVAGASHVNAYDIDTGKGRKLAALPQNSSTDAFLGYVRPAGASYLVTQTAVYERRDAGFVVVASVDLPTEATVSAASWGGTGGAARIFVADEGSSTIFIVDLGATPPAVTSVTSGVNGPWDLQFSNSTGKLVLLGAYKLYSVTASSGATKQLMAIPDGPGYPRVNLISPDGLTFGFFDFGSVYTIDLVTAKVATQAPFTAAPKVVGYPQWVSGV